MRYVTLLGVLLFVYTQVFADLIITITGDLDDHTLGYRVYRYDDGEKTMIYEGQESEITLPHTETAIYGVVSYNDHAESEVIPRIATFTPQGPSPITWTMEVTITPPEVNNGN